MSDHSIPQFSSGEALTITREKSFLVPFILVTGNTDEQFANDIINQGTDDYISKDQLALLTAAIRAALGQRKYLQEALDLDML